MRTLVRRTRSTRKNGSPFFKAKGSSGYFGIQTTNDKFIQNKPDTEKDASLVQMKPKEEEEPVQSKQNSENEEEEPVQKKGEEEE